MRHNKKGGRIDWIKEKEHIQAVVLGSMGFSTKMIRSRTNLTPCQIGYRLKQFEVKRMDYRNGINFVAQRVVHDIHGWTERQLRERLRGGVPDRSYSE